jgi:hypothetical protein
VEKKELNIWKNKVDVEIPEIEEVGGSKTMMAETIKEDPMATPFMLNMKVNSLQEIERQLNSFTIQSSVLFLIIRTQK